MQTIQFTYTKSDGSVSERLLLAVSSPSDKYSGIDLSDLEPTKAAEFIALMEKLHSEYLNFVKELQERYDVKHNFRQFLIERMTQISRIS